MPEITRQQQISERRDNFEVSTFDQFIETIPNPNRIEAITNASRKRVDYIAKIWRREFDKLPQDIITKNNLTDDVESWNRYLRFVYDKENQYQKGRFEFEEWSIKYTYEMLNALEQDVTYQTHEIETGQKKREDLLKVPNSFYEYHSKYGTFNGVISRGIYNAIERDSLLAHSISKNNLDKVIKSGVLGAGGLGPCALSQDRIIYDDGYVVVFQAKDLIDAGYPLLQINEDIRDAHVLKEWRTPMPIDINLARLVVSTTQISDRDRVANQAQIAHTFFGEEFLKQIPRI